MKKLGILGVGKMGGSILKGIFNAKLYNADEIIIYTPNKDHQQYYKNLNIEIALNEIDLFEKSQIIILAIKPQMFKEALKDINNLDFVNKYVISIAAGINIKTLEGYFKNAYVIRAMPNTPALIQKATTTVCFNKQNMDKNIVLDIFNSIGQTIEVDEEKIDTAIPLNGSMPAYLYYFCKCFIEYSANYNIDYEMAKQLCVNSIIGSCNMILQSKDSIDTLIDNVCSKKGATLEGLQALYDNNFKESIEKCYKACVNRTIELSKE